MKFGIRALRNSAEYTSIEPQFLGMVDNYNYYLLLAYDVQLIQMF